MYADEAFDIIQRLKKTLHGYPQGYKSYEPYQAEHYHSMPSSKMLGLSPYPQQGLSSA
jgi:hypothetical protein